MKKTNQRMGEILDLKAKCRQGQNDCATFRQYNQSESQECYLNKYGALGQYLEKALQEQVI